MKQLRLFGLTLMAIFVVGAITAATASANPTILPTPTKKEPLKFTSEGGKSTFTSPGGTFECEKVTNKGSFTSSEHAEDVEIHFEGNCHNVTTGNKCKTGTDVNGTILLLADFLIVDILPVPNELRLGLLILILTPELTEGPVIITCGTGKVELKGDVIGLIDGPTSLVKTKTGKLLLHESKEKQEFKECDLLEENCLVKGVHKKFELLAKFAAAEAFTEVRVTTEDTITLEKEVEFHF